MTPTDMGPPHAPSGRRRRTLVTVPASAESVPPRPQQAEPHQQTHQHTQQQPHQQPYQPPYQQPRRPPAYQPPPQQTTYQQPQQTYPQPQQAYQQQPQQTYQPPQPHLQDPPIYRAMISHWADRGRTLPGRHDPEWARLMAPPRGQFSASRDPRGDGR
ncbi:hypothetical protein DMA15_05395 [Streptomyces sp. WAC 01529]|nr:hypothetical protein DMA15_05395 [Streptomyces sp. WAC 01529]